MRIKALALLLLAAAATTASAQTPVVQKAVVASAVTTATAEPRTLGAADVDAEMKPLAQAIQRCYVDAAASVTGAGKLDVTLEINRSGKLHAVTVATPGLSARLARKIDGCVRAVVEPVQFPARKAFTTAVVPFFFQRTAAPGAGPAYSCWSPRGCRTE